MNFELIISVIIFLAGFILFLCWQPTRIVLKEILLHPFSDSKIRVVPKEENQENNYKGKTRYETPTTSTSGRA